MRVPALPSITVSRAAALVSLVLLASACDFRKIPLACSVHIAPNALTLPVNGTVPVVGTAFDCKNASIAKKVVKYSTADGSIADITPTGLVIGIAVGSTTVSAVADGKSESATVTVTPERAVNVTITPGSLTLRRTNTRPLAAVAKNAAGTVMPGRTFNWQSSNSSVASVDQHGVVTAILPGVANIIAETDLVTSNISVITVTEIPIGSCSLAPGSQTVLVGNQVQPTITLRDSANNPLATAGRVLDWVSSNDVAASVSNTGLVTAKKAGTTTITASSQQDASINCKTTVIVEDPKIASVHIAPLNAQLRIGIARQFTFTLLDASGVNIPPTNRTVSWRNVTPNIATVSNTGLITGVAIGTGRVAIDAEGAVDTVSFSITKIPVASVVVSPLQKSVVEGQTAQFTVTVKDSLDNVVTDRSIEWFTSDLNRASVTQTGLVTALIPGTVTISAVAENNQQRVGQASLVITAVPVDTILTITDFTVTVNRQSQFAIQLKDAAGNDLRNRQVVVNSDKPNISSGAANGQATTVTVNGSALGTAILTLQAVNSTTGANEGKPSKVTVTVIAPVPGSLTKGSGTP